MMIIEVNRGIINRDYIDPDTSDNTVFIQSRLKPVNIDYLIIEVAFKTGLIVQIKLDLMTSPII